MDIELKAESLQAKYQIHHNLFVTCTLDIVEANSDGMQAQISVRSRGDTVVPVGTKLHLIFPKPYPEIMADRRFEVLYVKVLGIEIIKGKPVQVCSPICREVRTDTRKHERKTCRFEVKLAELSTTAFTVVNGSINGLTLVDSTAKLFIGLGLGNEYHINATHKDEIFSFPAKVAHIHYDWRQHQHQVGVKILSLTPVQKVVLNRLIDPNFVLEMTQTASVDTDEALIRHDDMG